MSFRSKENGKVSVFELTSRGANGVPRAKRKDPRP